MWNVANVPAFTKRAAVGADALRTEHGRERTVVFDDVPDGRSLIKMPDLAGAGFTAEPTFGTHVGSSATNVHRADNGFVYTDKLAAIRADAPKLAAIQVNFADFHIRNVNH